MNEHTWEKLDADMRSDMAEEYIQERCPHEDLYVDNITVKIESETIRHKPDIYVSKQTYNTKNKLRRNGRWVNYLETEGTERFELYAEVVCVKCGASQEQYIDIGDIELIPETLLEWEE